MPKERDGGMYLWTVSVMVPFFQLTGSECWEMYIYILIHGAFGCIWNITPDYFFNHLRVKKHVE